MTEDLDYSDSERAQRAHAEWAELDSKRAQREHAEWAELEDAKRAAKQTIADF